MPKLGAIQLAELPRRDDPTGDGEGRHHPAHHDDRGCDWFASCLRCPLPVCRYDVGTNEANRLKRQAADSVVYQRSLELAALPRDEMAEQLAGEFSRTKRTIYRIISRASAGTGGPA